VNYNTDWSVFLNGASQMIYFGDLSAGTNCTYLPNFGLSFDNSQNITAVVSGLTSSLVDTSATWSLEINRLA
jgi:hypothetical protein